jgi:hypothetical protein
MKVTFLAYGPWQQALWRARWHECAQLPYPDDNGHLIRRIDVSYPGDGRAEFVIMFIGGSQQMFVGGAHIQELT